MHEPSPTPAPRQQSLSHRGTLPPQSAVRPLPVLPPPEALHHGSDSEGQRKKMSTNSATTVRAPGGAFLPSVTTSSATTAITPHTVSFPNTHHRNDSSTSIQGIAFSRPPGVSVTTLNGLKRESRTRVTSSNLSLAEEQGNFVRLDSPVLATDREWEQRRRTVNPRTVRVAMDGGPDEDYPPDPHESQTMRLPSSSTRRERRRTITEIFAGS